MTKHIGPIIAWIILAGVALYVVRHYADLLSGFTSVQELFNEGDLFDYFVK